MPHGGRGATVPSMTERIPLAFFIEDPGPDAVADVERLIDDLNSSREWATGSVERATGYARSQAEPLIRVEPHPPPFAHRLRLSPSPERVRVLTPGGAGGWRAAGCRPKGGSAVGGSRHSGGCTLYLN